MTLLLDTSTAVSVGCLCRGDCIPRLTFLRCYSTESYKTGTPRGVHLLTGCNGDGGRKSD